MNPIATSDPNQDNSSGTANRGHLQSILVRKQSQQQQQLQQQQQQQQRSYLQQNLGLKFNDQYTQYRASDLICTQDLLKTRNLNQLSSRRQRLQQRVTLKSLSEDGDKTNTGSTSRSPRRSLKRSVSSLNGLLKKPIEFVKSRSGCQQGADQSNQQRQHGRAQEERLGDDQYKVPSKQSFVSSSSLYLLPVPDYTVIIATRVVKDIILAHQRARHKEALRRSQQSASRTVNRLTNLIKTYSFRRSELESLAQQQQQHQGNRYRSIAKSFKSSAPTGGQTAQDGGRHDQDHETLDHSVSKIRAKVRMPSGKSDKATIVDNKDGTIKISYEPKEVGAHEIALRYNDEPIDESPVVFYVDAIGSAKKKITAYGAGLSRGVVGEQNKFTINTGGLGSAKLNITVDGPSKTQVELADNKDGTITVGYVPLVPGEYKITLSFDGKQVVGSPYSATIGDEGRQRSRLSVNRGNEHSFDLKISEDDLKQLDVIIVTPCGLEEPCGLKLLQGGHLAIVYTPREQGDHLVNVKRRGQHIAGSPFKFQVPLPDIGDAKQVKLSGDGLREGKANGDNEIVINTREAGYGGLSVALEGPGRSEIVCKESLDGNIKLSYKPYEPGQYSLVVKYADHVVPGSPFIIQVSGQATNLQRASLKKYRKLMPGADVGSECQLSFKITGAVGANDLSAKIYSPRGSSEVASIKHTGNDVYQVSFVPKEVSLHSLSIRNKQTYLHGSPFPFTVGPLLDFGPHKVRCGGSGLIKGQVGGLNEFDIYTREAGAGELNIIVEGPSKAELAYTDRKDGSCHVGYKVAEPGEYRISVLFDDQEVPESPFRSILMSEACDASKIALGPLPGENSIQLDKPYSIPILLNGAKGDIEAQVKVPCGKWEDCLASSIDADTWAVRFVPREFGIYQAHIKCQGFHIAESPLFVRVGHDNADPAAILVHGPGLKSAIVNHATDFTVETCNAGHSMLEVNIEGPSKVSMGCAELDEGYKINYTPLAPGDYLISIKYSGCHIGSSPFKVRAIRQPGSKTIADAGSHEISTIAISTTDRAEARQKMDQVPKFNSDATRVRCKGVGLKKLLAGKPNTLTIDCSEAGFDLLFVSFLGPTRDTIHECSIKHAGRQIYELKHTCKDKGDAMLIVKYGDEQIPGSPFKLEYI